MFSYDPEKGSLFLRLGDHDLLVASLVNEDNTQAPYFMIAVPKELDEKGHAVPADSNYHCSVTIGCTNRQGLLTLKRLVAYVEDALNRSELNLKATLEKETPDDPK
jgi:hypothetical protein